MTHKTMSLPDGRSIEASLETHGGRRLRLRARLVGPSGLVQEALRRDYDATETGAIADFAAEFDRLTGLSIDHSLFELERAESLPKEFARDPQIAAAQFDPDEEIQRQRWRFANLRP